MNQFPAEKEEGLIESLLFISGEPVASQRLADLLGKSVEEVDEQLNRMSQAWSNNPNRGCNLVAIAEGWQMVTKKEYATLLKEFFHTLNRPRKLSATTLETLAIIAGKQPVTKQEVEMIRGVSADYAIGQLLALELIEEVGKKPGMGRAILYGTTQQFLIHFGLRSLKDLPDKLQF